MMGISVGVKSFDFFEVVEVNRDGEYDGIIFDGCLGR